MLSLPVVDSPPVDTTYDGDPLVRVTFLLGDTYYIVHGNLGDFEIHWSMETMDMRTFKVSNIDMLEHTFCPQSDDDGSVECVVVHNNKAFIWDLEAQILYEGSVENGGFQWEMIDHEGSEVFNGITFGYNNEAGDVFYCSTNHEEDGKYSIYRVNLNAMTPLVWERSAIPQPRDQAVFEQLTALPLESSYYEAFVIGEGVHFITKQDRSDGRTAKFASLKAHLILHLPSLQWSMSRAYDHEELPPPWETTLFIHNKKIWMIHDHEDMRGKSVLHRYDETADSWIKMGEIDDDVNCFGRRAEPVSVGNRVIFMKGRVKRVGRRRRNVISILEFDPTLLDRAAVVVARDRRLSYKALQTLPDKFRVDLIERRILIGEDEECDEEDDQDSDENVYEDLDDNYEEEEVEEVDYEELPDEESLEEEDNGPSTVDDDYSIPAKRQRT